MNAVYSNMLWLPKDEVDCKKLKAELTVPAIVYAGNGFHVKMYSETPYTIGVPRAWGMKQKWLLSKIEKIEMKVKSTEIHFPEFQWPDGYDYRKGQKESIAAIQKYWEGALHNGGALLEAKTGSGKTLMSLILASQLKAKTLIVVP